MSNGGSTSRTDVEISRSLQTEADYERVAKRLVRKAAREIGIEGENGDPVEIVTHVLKSMHGLKQASQRYYRASLNNWLDRQMCPRAEEARALLDASRGRHSESERRQPLKKRTSALRAKSVRDQEYLDLDRALAKSRSAYSGALRHWLIADKYVGLRPCEWIDASLNASVPPPILTIKNAKNSNGRTHGKYRRLKLVRVPPKDVQVIQRHIATVQAFTRQGRYLQYYTNCAVLLRRYSAQLRRNGRPVHICLYSSRHQFAANAKTTLPSRIEVAAAMGHASVDTAGENYGRRAQGSGGLAVLPAAEDVESVSRLNADAAVAQAKPASAPQPPEGSKQ